MHTLSLTKTSFRSPKYTFASHKRGKKRAKKKKKKNVPVSIFESRECDNTTFFFSFFFFYTL